MNFMFCKLEKAQKTWISFFASLKNVKRREFHFFESFKSSKSLNLIFCKLEKAQKTWISFFFFWQIAPNSVKVATDGNIFGDKTFLKCLAKIFYWLHDHVEGIWKVYLNYSRAKGSFQKSVFLGGGCEYFFIDVSYGLDFFTDAKNKVRRTFQIPRKCSSSQ